MDLEEGRRAKDALRKRRARALEKAARKIDPRQKLMSPVPVARRQIKTGDLSELLNLLRDEAEIVANIEPREPGSLAGARIIFERGKTLALLASKRLEIEERKLELDRAAAEVMIRLRTVGIEVGIEGKP